MFFLLIIIYFNAKFLVVYNFCLNVRKFATYRADIIIQIYLSQAITDYYDKVSRIENNLMKQY